MAKRANPFIEDFVPQSKTHVGQKQFNNNDDRLKKVYEKTLKILFRGAKKFPAQDIANTLCSNNNATKKDKMKQLFISKDGTLLHSGKIVDSQTLKDCGCSSVAESQCGYCEVPLCAMCQHPCVVCERNYCLHCTLNQSEQTEVCVSCYN